MPWVPSCEIAYNGLSFYHSISSFLVLSAPASCAALDLSCSGLPPVVIFGELMRNNALFQQGKKKASTLTTDRVYREQYKAPESTTGQLAA
ncbi:unnamed protein product [Arctogadus glacialis]